MQLFIYMVYKSYTLHIVFSQQEKPKKYDFLLPNLFQYQFFNTLPIGIWNVAKSLFAFLLQYKPLPEFIESIYIPHELYQAEKGHFSRWKLPMEIFSLVDCTCCLTELKSPHCQKQIQILQPLILGLFKKHYI